MLSPGYTKVYPHGIMKKVEENVLLTFLTGGGGAHSTMDSILALHPAAPGLILGTPVPSFIERCLVTETVAFERTHLVQSRGPQIQLECTPS